MHNEVVLYTDLICLKSAPDYYDNCHLWGCLKMCLMLLLQCNYKKLDDYEH